MSCLDSKPTLSFRHEEHLRTHLRTDTRRTFGPAGLLALAVLLLPACSDDDNGVGPDGLTEADLVGSYEATTFTVTEGGSTTDVLAEGGSLSIALAADNTTTGTLVTPASLSEDGTEEVDDLAGTWSLSGSTVTFSQAADTFVRDSEFQATTTLLEAEETFGDVTVRVVLFTDSTFAELRRRLVFERAPEEDEASDRLKEALDLLIDSDRREVHPSLMGGC